MLLSNAPHRMLVAVAASCNGRLENVRSCLQACSFRVLPTMHARIKLRCPEAQSTSQHILYGCDVWLVQPTEPYSHERSGFSIEIKPPIRNIRKNNSSAVACTLLAADTRSCSCNERFGNPIKKSCDRNGRGSGAPACFRDLLIALSRAREHVPHGPKRHRFTARKICFTKGAAVLHDKSNLKIVANDLNLLKEWSIGKI